MSKWVHKTCIAMWMSSSSNSPLKAWGNVSPVWFSMVTPYHLSSFQTTSLNGSCLMDKMPSTGFPVARQRQKACIVLNLSHVVKESNKTSVPELVVDAATLLQRDALDVSVPFDENPIMTALERMIPKIAEYC